MENEAIRDYPSEWDELSKYERRKKLKELKRQKVKKAESFRKIRKVVLKVALVVVLVGGYMLTTKKSPEEIDFKEKIEAVSLEGKVEEFSIEGRDHVLSEVKVEYKTNPPTSGGHLAQAENWGVYDKEIDDKAAVHSLEHGGIWISYRDIGDEEIKILEEIGKNNSQRVVVSPRSLNDDKIVVTSWGKMMKLEKVEKALIQRYINTYVNQSPEKLAI